MEIYNYYYDFEIPWWNTVTEIPEICMPNTMQYLEENFEGKELENRWTQIMRGLEAGRDEVLAITKRYLLNAPILLLMPSNRKRGPSFYRAVLSVLHEYQDRMEAPPMNDEGDDWGIFIYDAAANRPEEERVWYDLMTIDDTHLNDILHF